jgi:hypothetical protein
MSDRTPKETCVEKTARVLEDRAPSSSADPVIQGLHRLATTLRLRARDLGIQPPPMPQPRWAQQEQEDDEQPR